MTTKEYSITTMRVSEAGQCVTVEDKMATAKLRTKDPVGCQQASLEACVTWLVTSNEWPRSGYGMIHALGCGNEMI